MKNTTVLSCASCFSAATYQGRPTNIKKCPSCGCNNPALVRVRYWKNGSPDYSINLLKTK